MFYCRCLLVHLLLCPHTYSASVYFCFIFLYIYTVCLQICCLTLCNVRCHTSSVSFYCTSLRLYKYLALCTSSLSAFSPSLSFRIFAVPLCTFDPLCTLLPFDCTSLSLHKFACSPLDWQYDIHKISEPQIMLCPVCSTILIKVCGRLGT